MGRKTSENGIDMIKGFESFSAKPYQDSVGVWTNGYGHTHGVMADTPPVTMEEALANLAEDLVVAERSIEKLVTVFLTDNQFDALVSFIFNLGEGNFAHSTLRTKLNAGDYAGAAEEFERWVYAGGKKLNGLINRRKKEKELFLS